MFNLNQKAEDGEPNRIVVPLPPGSSTEKVEVRWPTDSEWCDRIRNFRTTHTSTGRSFRRTGDNRKDVSLELFRKISLNGHGETIDEAEALYIIEKLERVQCVGVERLGDQFEIKLKVQGGTTVHTVKAPSQKRVLAYNRAASPDAIQTVRHGTIEVRERMEPAGQLYDELAQKPAEGYVVAVPIVHKFQVIKILLEEMENIAQAQEEDDDPED
jgi:hypothetical protein